MPKVLGQIMTRRDLRRQIVGLVIWLLVLALYVVFVLFVLPSATAAQCPDGRCPTPVAPRLDTGGWQAVPTQTRPAARPNPAVVRVVCDTGNCRGVGCTGCKSVGTGTIVDSRKVAAGRVAAVVTAAHLFRDATQSAQYYVVAKGKRYNATVRHLDKTWDVAVLAIWDPGITPIALSEKTPVRGDTGRLIGFGQGSYRQVVGRLTQYVAPRKNVPFEWAEYSAASRDGDSGGPVLNAEGQLVGVISSTNARATVGCCLPRLRAILRCVLPPYPRRPGVIIPKPVVVVPLPTPTPAPTPGPIDYDRLAEIVLAKLASDPRFRGPAGPIGPPGEPGPQGPTGGAGPTPAIDYEALAKALIAKLPPVRVEWERLDGTILKQEKPLGEPLRFKSVEIDARK